MISADDAAQVARALASNIDGVARNPANFKRLPDKFWGYYARGHDKNGHFGVFIAYSEDETDVDGLIETYESWVSKKTDSARQA